MITPREVTLGATSDTRIEVLRGLAAGETVVASATFLVDAESNLGTALGGMGNMPGMEVSTPPKALPVAPVPATRAPATNAAPAVTPAPQANHAGHTP